MFMYHLKRRDGIQDVPLDLIQPEEERFTNNTFMIPYDGYRVFIIYCMIICCLSCTPDPLINLLPICTIVTPADSVIIQAGDLELYLFFKEKHKATCTDCGKACEVPFKPTPGKDVRCQDCFRASRNQILIQLFLFFYLTFY